MTPQEYSDRQRDKISRIRELASTERSQYLRFIKAARQHTLALRPGDTALYIEDDPAKVSLIKSLIEHAFNRLESDQLKILTAFTVNAAQAILKEKFQSIKLVVMDLDFGGTGEGKTLLQWIVQQFEGSLPTLALVNYPEEISQLQQDFPTVDFCLKSESHEKMTDAVRHVESNRYSRFGG